MSLFSRLADRGGFAPKGAAAPVMVPKGRNIRRAEALPEEEEEMQPVRISRQVEEEEEEALQPSRIARQPVEEEDEEELQPARLRRQPEEEEEEMQPARLRRQTEEEEEEAIQPSRLARQPAEEEEEEMQPARLRRQTEEEEEEAIQPSRLRRAERPDDPDLDPATAPPLDVPLDEPEPSDLRARREVAGPAHTPGTAGGIPSDGPGFPPEGAGFPSEAPEFPSDAHGFPPHEPGFSSRIQDRFERPNVVIDQVDVLIHEPAAPPTRAPGPSRSLRARYLRRL